MKHTSCTLTAGLITTLALRVLPVCYMYASSCKRAITDVLTGGRGVGGQSGSMS